MKSTSKIKFRSRSEEHVCAKRYKKLSSYLDNFPQEGEDQICGRCIKSSHESLDSRRLKKADDEIEKLTLKISRASKHGFVIKRLQVSLQEQIKIKSELERKMYVKE